MAVLQGAGEGEEGEVEVGRFSVEVVTRLVALCLPGYQLSAQQV